MGAAHTFCPKAGPYVPQAPVCLNKDSVTCSGISPTGAHGQALTIGQSEGKVWSNYPATFAFLILPWSLSLPYASPPKQNIQHLFPQSPQNKSAHMYVFKLVQWGVWKDVIA